MYDDPAVVQRDPSTVIVTRNAQPNFAACLVHAFDFFRDGLHLTSARSRRDDKAIENAGLLGQIQNEDILGFVLSRSFRRDFGKFDAVRQRLHRDL